jgi:5-methylcytosine-specific restriction endonuclease McrA
MEKRMARDMEKYKSYLKSDAWAAKKTRWIKSDYCKGHVCHAKGCTSTKRIEFHHRTYERLGNENLSDIVMLCRSCHSLVHKLKRSGFSLRDASSCVIDKPGE